MNSGPTVVAHLQLAVDGNLLPAQQQQLHDCHEDARHGVHIERVNVGDAQLVAWMEMYEITFRITATWLTHDMNGLIVRQRTLALVVLNVGSQVETPDK